MPLATHRWKPRFDVLFLSAIGCSMVTFCLLNLKSSQQPQASHSFVKLEKPSIRYEPSYRGGDNKRMLERETSPSRNHKDSSAQALDESKVDKSHMAVDSVPELRTAKHAQIGNDNTPLHVKNGTDTEQVPWETLLARNNMLSVYTGCSIATWTYGSMVLRPRMRKWYDDCGHYNAEKNLQGRDITPDTVSLLQSGDSIYVELVKLNRFVSEMLPLITTDVVLISGQNHLAPMKPPLRPPYSRNTFYQVVNNEHVTHWFMMNLSKHCHEPFHEKMHPWPYGLSHLARGSGVPKNYNPESKRHYLEELAQHLNRTKTNSIFVGYISRDSNTGRKVVPQGEKMPPQEYYKSMHESKYILSPDGDRPECYRHYEAIGLGTMPITQLHPYLYRHLAGNAIFNETRWNLTDMERSLSPNPQVNRRLLFEEYWMEYVERVTGRPMWWWDSKQNVLSLLSEITNTAKLSNAEVA